MSSSNSNTKCKTCSKVIKGSNETKLCSLCSCTYHYQCLGITTENFFKESKQAKQNWKCPDCKGTEKRGNYTPSPPQTSSSAIEDLKSYFDTRLNEATATFLAQVKEQIALENKNIHRVIEELKISVSSICNQYEELNKIISEKSQMIETLKTE